MENDEANFIYKYTREFMWGTLIINKVPFLTSQDNRGMECSYTGALSPAYGEDEWQNVYPLVKCSDRQVDVSVSGFRPWKSSEGSISKNP